MRTAAGTALSLLIVGLWGVAARAERVDAIAMVVPKYLGAADQSTGPLPPVLVLLAVSHNGKWILNKRPGDGDQAQDDRSLPQDVYDRFKGRTFVPADGSPGQFTAGASERSFYAGEIYVMACQGTRPAGKIEETIVVTGRPMVPGPGTAWGPKPSAFLPFARRAICSAEQKQLERIRASIHGEPGFEPSSRIPIATRELKPIALGHGSIAYWISMEKPYEHFRMAKEDEIIPSKFFYYGLFSGALPGRWRCFWECVRFSGDGEGECQQGFLTCPSAICDVNGDSQPELVMRRDEYEAGGWQALELRGGKSVEIGSLLLGY